MDLHRLAEARSLAFHEEIARRLTEEPAIIERARATVEAWAASGLLHPEYARRWREVLSRSPGAIAEALRDPSESARALRQSTPFVGVLDPQTRWRIWRELGERADRGGEP